MVARLEAILSYDRRVKRFCLTLISAFSAGLAAASLSCVELPIAPSRYLPVASSGPYLFTIDQIAKQPVVFGGPVLMRLRVGSVNPSVSGGSPGYAVGSDLVSSSSVPTAWNLKTGKRIQFSGPGNLYATSGRFAVGSLNGVPKVFDLVSLQSSSLPTPANGFVTPLAMAGQSVAGVFINTAVNQRHAYFWPDYALPGVDFHPTGSTDSSILSTDGVQQGGQFALPGAGGDVRHPALCSGTAASLVDLTVPNSTDGYVKSVLAGYQLGQVTDTSGVVHTILWHGSAGSAVDLNQFPPSGRTPSPTWPVGLATVSGRLYAYGVCDSTDRVYRWTVL